MRSVSDTYNELMDEEPSTIVKRIALPFEAGFLAPVSAIKSYCEIKGFNYNLVKTGGVLFKDYVLTIYGETVETILKFLDFLEELEKANG